MLISKASPFSIFPSAHRKTAVKQILLDVFIRKFMRCQRFRKRLLKTTHQLSTEKNILCFITLSLYFKLFQGEIQHDLEDIFLKVYIYTFVHTYCMIWNYIKYFLKWKLGNIVYSPRKCEKRYVIL